MKKTFKSILLLILITTIFAFTGCGFFESDSGSPSPSPNPSPNPSRPKEKIQIDSTSLEYDVSHLINDSYTITISGIAKNVSGKNLSYVAISYNVFDSDNNQIGITIDNIANLANGGTWKFSTTGITNGQPAKYKLAEIQAF